MSHISKNKAGLALGVLLALYHVCWAALVAAGLAQPFVDWIFLVHFVQPPYFVIPFDLGQALILILATFAFGYAVGWVLAAIWNWLHPTTVPASGN